MTEQQNSGEQTTLGAYLKRLRNEKNISVAEMAAKMYLHTRVIEALEQDDHENLPGRLYVHGYLQLYAKILDVPADEILAMYKEDTSEPREPATKTREQVTTTRPSLEPMKPVEPLEPPEPLQPKTKQPGRWIHAIIYLGLFILVLASFAVWRSKYAQEPEQVTGALDYPITIVEHPDKLPDRVPDSERMETAQTTVDTEAPAPDTPSDLGTIQEPATAPVPFDELQTARTQEPETPTATTERDSGTAPIPEERTITSGIGPDTVTLVLNTDCWVEIFDADDGKVFYDLARAGQTLVLSGTAPFSVLLGNADAATVEFNSVPFDITPHVTGIGIARFVLGETE